MVKETRFHFQDEFKVSLGPVVAILLCLSVILIPLADAQMDPVFRKRVLIIVAGFYGVSLASWLLSMVRPWIAKSFFICALLAIVHVGLIWKLAPGYLIFLTLPILLSMTLLHVYLGIGIAALETILLLFLRPVIAPAESSITVFITLLSSWSLVGGIYNLYHASGRISNWAWAYYQRALRVLQETRDEKQEMGQVMEDLAQANLQLKRLNILAQSLRQAAEDARTAKEQFVANVSHELRTPLNMIIGFSEMILKNPGIYRSKIPPALLADLTVINRNAEHLASLINDVLDLSQIEADRMALTKEHVSIVEIVEAAVTAVRPLYESKGLYLRTEIPEGIPLLFCDRTRIREVLLNLLSNAGRFTERGGVCIQARQTENQVTLSVTDTGKGISPEDLEKLFEPFQQLDGSIRREFGGTGLGLSISKRFVELHDGKMWVESQLGKGTSFYFQLPLAVPVAGGGGAQRWFSPGWEFRQRTHPSKAPNMPVRTRYVVLESGQALHRLLSRYMDNIETIPVKTLEQANQKVAAVPGSMLLINNSSVGQTLETLKNPDFIHSTPAIICDLPEAYETLEHTRIIDYLVKPVTTGMLESAINHSELKRGKTILIVDNEPELQRLFRRMLLSFDRDYRVLSALDGRQALDILRQEQVDLIFLDLVMPGMNGVQMLATKEQDTAIKDIPVIIISARDPLSQPVASHTLVLTVPEGLPASRLLACIDALSSITSGAMKPAAPEPT